MAKEARENDENKWGEGEGEGGSGEVQRRRDTEIIMQFDSFT